MKTLRVLELAIIFLLGFLSANLFSFFFVYGLENPLSKNVFNINGIEKTPNDYLNENQIEVYPDKIIINVNNATIGRYASTGSMVPVLNENTNGIRIVPRSTDEIKVGDIITYINDDTLIIHRVVDKGIDDNGIYYITKGDSNPTVDGKIRFNQIKYKTIGVLW